MKRAPAWLPRGPSWVGCRSRTESTSKARRPRFFENYPDAEWVDTEGIRTEMEAAIIDLAIDLGEAALADDEPAVAFWAARSGLRASPYEERLFQLAFRAAKAEGSTGKMRALMRELRTVLDVEIEPEDGIGSETLALYEELIADARPAGRG